MKAPLEILQFLPESMQLENLDLLVCLILKSRMLLKQTAGKSQKDIHSRTAE